MKGKWKHPRNRKAVVSRPNEFGCKYGRHMPGSEKGRPIKISNACAMKAFLKSKGFKSCSTNKRLAAAYYNNKYAQEADKTGNVFSVRGFGKSFRESAARARARIASGNKLSGRRRGPAPSTSKRATPKGSAPTRTMPSRRAKN